MQEIKIEDLLSYTNLGNLKTCGKSVVWVQAIADHDKQDQYKYTLTTLKNGQVVPLSSFGQERDFVFLEENTVLFAGNRENKDDRTDIYRLSLTGGEATVIGVLDQSGFSISKVLDQTHLLLTRRVDLNKEGKTSDPDQKDYTVYTENPFWFNNQGIINGLRDKLFVYDLQTNQLKELATGDQFFTVNGVWVNDDQIFYTGQSYTGKRKWLAGLYQLDWRSGKQAQLVAEGAWDIAALHFVKDQIWVVASDTKHYGMNENPNLYKLTSHGLELLATWGKTFGNTVDADICLLDTRVTASTDQGNDFYFVTTEIDCAKLVKFNGQAFTEILQFASIDFFDFTSDGTLYFSGSRANELPQIFSYQNGQVTQLSHYNEAQLADKYLAKVQTVEFTDADQNIQHGWVLLPKDYQPGCKYPAILDVHGGPKTVYGEVFFHEMQVWASQGYFVLFCNIHGSDGQGNDFMDIRGKYGTIDYEDLMAFTDAALKAHPDIDQGNLGITGGSYGGFMTNWVIGHTKRFKAAASQRSIANWLSFAHTSDIAPEFAQDQNAADEYTNAEKLWWHSPLKYANQVETPTLFINSDQDYRCPISEGTQMYHALSDRGIESRMCIFHGENHELSRSGQPKHRIRRLQEITNWMNQHLKQGAK